MSLALRSRERFGVKRSVEEDLQHDLASEPDVAGPVHFGAVDAEEIKHFVGAESLADRKPTLQGHDDSLQEEALPYTPCHTFPSPYASNSFPQSVLRMSRTRGMPFTGYQYPSW